MYTLRERPAAVRPSDAPELGGDARPGEEPQYVRVVSGSSFYEVRNSVKRPRPKGRDDTAAEDSAEGAASFGVEGDL